MSSHMMQVLYPLFRLLGIWEDNEGKLSNDEAMHARYVCSTDQTNMKTWEDISILRVLPQ